MRAALEKLRAATKKLRKDTITEPPNLVDDDEENDTLGKPLPDSTQSPNNIVEELRKIPQFLLENAEKKLSSAEKTLEHLEDRTNPFVENTVLRSEPLEDSLELFSPRSEKIDPFRTDSRLKDHRLLATPGTIESSENDQLAQKGKSSDIVAIANRGKFDEDKTWSESLGSLVPGDDITVNSPKDIFFVGSGIKLPLNMVKKNDGAVHLAVDLQKLCGCRNATCPHNKTAIEETVGSILTKEAVLIDQLEHASSTIETDDKKPDEILGAAPSSINANQDSTGNSLLTIKNSIATGFGSSELQHENPEILKRSAEDPKLKVENVTTSPNKNEFERVISEVPEVSDSKHKIIKLEGKDYKALKEKEQIADSPSTFSSLSTSWKNLLHPEPSQPSSNFFTDFWNKGFEDIKSRLPSIGSLNPLSLSQQTISSFSNPVNDELEEEIKKLTTEAPLILQSVPTKPIEEPEFGSRFKSNVPSFDFFNPLVISQKVLKDLLPIPNGNPGDNPEEPLLTPDLGFQPIQTIKPPDFGSRLKNFFAEKFDKDDEKFDKVSEVRGPYKFKGLENQGMEPNLKKYDDTAENYKRQNEEVLKEGALDLLKENEKYARENVNNFMNWLKGVSLRNEK